MVSHQECASVPAITSSASRRSTSTCPFCHQSFKRLGCHLPKCKQRGDRDYSVYLSDKTLRKAQKLNRQCCPKCHHSFRRLDTHLRVSATCKSILTNTAQVQPVAGVGNDAAGPSASQPDPLHASAPSSRTCAVMQRPLSLPKTAEEWVEADQLLQTEVVPAVLSCTSVEDKNNTLLSITYNILCNRFGIKASAQDTKETPTQQEAV